MTVKDRGIYTNFAGLILLLLIASCGGGGGGNPPPSNKAPSISSIIRTPTGAVANNTSVSITAVASDPESDALSYAWSLASGDGVLFGSSTESSVTWVAPAGGSGASTLQIIVSDSNGGSTPGSITIPWGIDPPVIGKLSITIKETPATPTGVQGLYVALYEADNRTIAQTLRTDVNGVADFGEQTGPVSITVTYDNKYVRTYMGIDPGDYTFYRDYRDWKNKNFTSTTNNVAAEQVGGNPIETAINGNFGRGMIFWFDSTTFIDPPVTITGGSDAWYQNDIENLLVYSKSYSATDAGPGYPHPNERGDIFKYALVSADMTLAAPVEFLSDYTNFSVATPLTWSTNGIPALLSVHAQTDDGAFYQIGLSDLFNVHTTSGTTMIAGDLPIMTKFITRAVNLSNTTAHSSFQSLTTDYSQSHVIEHGVRQGYTSTQSNVTLDFADRVVSSLTYNLSPAAKQFDFVAEGSSEIDYIIFFYENDLIDWWIYADGNTRSITLPDLPSNVDSRVRNSANLVDNAAFGNYLQLGVSVVNLDTYSNYDDALQVHMNTYEPLDQSNREQWSSYETYFYVP